MARKRGFTAVCMPTKKTSRLCQQRAREQMRAAFVASWLESRGRRMAGEALWRALGFGSKRSFDRAARDGRLPVPLYPLPVGRGRFARTEDVANWVWQQMEQRRKGGDTTTD